MQEQLPYEFALITNGRCQKANAYRKGQLIITVSFDAVFVYI